MWDGNAGHVQQQNHGGVVSVLLPVLMDSPDIVLRRDQRGTIVASCRDTQDNGSDHPRHVNSTEPRQRRAWNAGKRLMSS
jgi:hypothetical protein